MNFGVIETTVRLIEATILNNYQKTSAINKLLLSLNTYITQITLGVQNKISSFVLQSFAFASLTVVHYFHVKFFQQFALKHYISLV